MLFTNGIKNYKKVTLILKKYSLEIKLILEIVIIQNILNMLKPIKKSLL